MVEDLRAAVRLAIQGTRGVTDAVEEMHVAIASGPAVLGRPLAGVARALTAPVYAGVRGVTSLVGAGLDLALAELGPVLADAPAPEASALRAALNGVVGDTLAANGSSLAIEMRLRSGGAALPLTPDGLRAALPGATGRVLVLVHGSCMNDRQWARDGHDHGAALANDLGFTPVYLHYNTGLHVSTNGRAFAALLQSLLDAWPVPVTDLTLLVHSMGGLVSRSAVHVAEEAGLPWRRALRSMVFLGTPHQGAPLERIGNWAEAALGVAAESAPLARLAQLRSAGVTDLRYGNVLDAHWEGRDRFALGGDPEATVPLPAGVACFAVAGQWRLDSDGLVPVASALGRHPDPARALAFPASHQWVGAGMKHLDLLSRRDAYDQIRAWLA